MPGRNPKLIQQIEEDNTRTRYTKGEIEARRENTPVVESARLRPPAWLGKGARKEFKRIIKLAINAGIYTDLDINALGMYCMSFERLTGLYRELERLQSLTPRDALISSAGQRLMRAIRAEEDHCKKYGGLLGLDPVARARIGLAKSKKPDDPFEDFLNELDD